MVSRTWQQWCCSNNRCIVFCSEQNLTTMMLCKQPMYSILWWAECDNNNAVWTTYVKYSVVSRMRQQWCCSNNLCTVFCGEQNATTVMLCKQLRYSILWWAELDNNDAVQTTYLWWSVVSRMRQQWCCANNLCHWMTFFVFKLQEWDTSSPSEI